MLSALVLAVLTGPRIDLDVVYSTVAGESLKMDVYYPERATSGPAPAVLVLHGGAWITGKRQDMAEIAQAMAKQGFVAATPSYRLAPKYKWPAMLDDAQTAMRFLRSKAKDYNLDPKRIGAIGASAGAQMALMLGFRETRDLKPTEFADYSSRAQAVFDLFGPSDFRRDYPPSLDPLFQTVLGKKKADAAQELKEASPVEWITPDDAPVFILHGDADPLVPVAQSTFLKEKLDAAKVRCELKIVPKMVHGIDKNAPEQLQGVEAGAKFLVDALKP